MTTAQEHIVINLASQVRDYLISRLDYIRERASADALEFLQQWEPNGLWVLTAIHPDDKTIETKTFYSREEKAASRWIEGWLGKRNLYFGVNRITRGLTTKAK